MKLFEAVYQQINSYIRKNGRQEITGDVLNGVLRNMVEATEQAMTEESELVNEKITELKNDKVDKVEGKELSSNDFTDEEKGKLSRLENYDDSALRKMIESKVSKVTGKGLSTNDFSNEEKNKLASLENYDDTELRTSLSEIQENVGELKTSKADKKFVEEALAGIGGGVTFVSVTYTELVALRDNKELVAGSYYRITDYMTTTAQENTRSAGHPFDVIVTADSANKLNEVARAGFPTFNIERYRLGFSPSWAEAMNYIGLYEHNGRTYYQYQSASEDMQMLVAFSEEINMTNVTDDPMGQRFMWVIYPSYGRKYENDVWGEWKSGESLGENIAFETNPNSAYFHDADAKLEAWKIWYCLDNDTERFAWADTESGKGVIYRMIDEWNNDCPYDFKNIMFKRSLYEGGQGIDKNGDADADVYCYTLSWEDEQFVIMDSSIVGNNGYLLNDEGQILGVYGNLIKPYISYTGEVENPRKICQFLNNIVFLSNYGYDGRLYYGCYSNSFGNSCYSNSFGNYCNNNSFGNSCYSNSFGNSCYSNSFGNVCTSNSFGNYCNNNSLGNDCSYNSFGNSCYDNRFIDMDGIADYVYYNKLDDGVNNVVLYHNDDKGSYESLKNHHVCRGVSRITIDLYDDRNYETTYAMKSDGTIRVFVIADLQAS